MSRLSCGRGTSILLLLLGCTAHWPAQAEIGLRVASHPIAAPIDAYVRVTAEGKSVAGLTTDDFSVTVDGKPVEQFALTLPPNQDSTQKVSVVIVIEEDRYELTPTYAGLIRRLDIGDMVAVVKYWGDVEQSRFGGVSVLPFTELDDGPGSAQVVDFIRERPYLTGWGTRHFYTDGLVEALAQFETASASLPAGPKVIATVACCGGWTSLSEIVARANTGGISLFNIGRVGWRRTLAAEMKALSANTGGVQVKLSGEAPSEDALPTMGFWLKDGYRVSIPSGAISDCGFHWLAVTVRGESASARFSRCDTTPADFRFRTRTDLPVATRVRSNAVTVADIDSAVPIRVFGGEYSIGCATGFTSEPGRIRPGESVCVRHVTASGGGQWTATLLIVGGVYSWFESVTVN